MYTSQQTAGLGLGTTENLVQTFERRDNLDDDDDRGNLPGVDEDIDDLKRE